LSSPSRKQLAGKAGSRRVIKDRFGRVIEDVGEQVPPVDGKDIQLSVDSKVQFFAYQKLRDAVRAPQGQGGQRGGDRFGHGRVAGVGQLPQLRP
jgi:cell division protein FtsI/penicillin-binding protein 2